MKIHVALLAIMMVSVAPLVPSMAADNRADRFALVIGNAKYPTPKRRSRSPSTTPARSPTNSSATDSVSRSGRPDRRSDAAGFRQALRANQARLRRADFLQRIRRPVRPPELYDTGRRPDLDGPDVRRDGFSLESVLGEINGRGAGVKIALIDASRRNPFERRFAAFRRPCARDRAERRW